MEPFKAEIKRDAKGRIVKGSAAIHPEGRPKGKTMKEFAREFLMNMDEEAKKKWLKGLEPEVVWKMAEGNPHQTQETEYKGTVTFEVVDYSKAEVENADGDVQTL